MDKIDGAAETSAIARLEQELATLARLLEAMNRRRAYPLERSHYLLLLQLRDGPRRVGELSKVLALDTTTVTRQLAAMEGQGFVSRRPDPEDRRSTLFQQTLEGAACAARMQTARKDGVSRLVTGWRPDEVAHFVDDLDRLNRSLYRRLEEGSGATDPEG